MSTYLVAWGGFPVSQTAAGRAVIGVAPIRRSSADLIPPLLRFGAGVDRLVAPRSVSPSPTVSDIARVSLARDASLDFISKLILIRRAMPDRSSSARPAARGTDARRRCRALHSARSRARRASHAGRRGSTSARASARCHPTRCGPMSRSTTRQRASRATRSARLRRSSSRPARIGGAEAADRISPVSRHVLRARARTHPSRAEARRVDRALRASDALSGRAA